MTGEEGKRHLAELVDVARGPADLGTNGSSCLTVGLD